MTEHSAAELRPLAMPGLAVIRIGRVIGSGRGSRADSRAATMQFQLVNVTR